MRPAPLLGTAQLYKMEECHGKIAVEIQRQGKLAAEKKEGTVKYKSQKLFTGSMLSRQSIQQVQVDLEQGSLKDALQK